VFRLLFNIAGYLTSQNLADSKSDFEFAFMEKQK